MLSEADINEALRAVIDPEIGLDFVELGLIYRVENGESAVEVTMTATSPSCPMRQHLLAERSRRPSGAAWGSGPLSAGTREVEAADLSP